MASQTEVPAPGEFIYSEADGTFSRENVTYVAGSGVIAAGRIVGKISATGKYRPYLQASSDGSQAAAGINYAEVDTTNGEVRGVIIVRDAEVVTNRITAADSTAKTAAIASLTSGIFNLVFR